MFDVDHHSVSTNGRTKQKSAESNVLQRQYGAMKAIHNVPSLHMQIGESMFDVEEQLAYAARITNSFYHETGLVSCAVKHSKVFNWSHNNLTSATAITDISGFCLEIGAPRYVIGKRLHNHVLKLIGKKKIDLIESKHTFKFGRVTVSSRVITECELKTPRIIPSITVVMNAAPVDVPELLGLDVVDAESLYVENVTNRLVHRYFMSRWRNDLSYEDDWSIRITRIDNQ